MAEDVWIPLVKGVLSFGQNRAADLVQTSFKDTGTFVLSLADAVNDQTVKSALQALKQDIDVSGAEGTAIVSAVQPDLQKAATAVTASLANIQSIPFDLAAAGRAADEIANVIIAFESGLAKVAAKVSLKSPSASQQAVNELIAGIMAPYKKTFGSLAAGAGKTLDAIVKQLLNQDNATQLLGEALTLNRDSKELTMSLTASGELSPIAGFPSFKLGDTELTAFFTFATAAAIGIRVKTKLQTGLRSDKLLESIIPASAPSTDTDFTSISLDSDQGLSFGEGKNKSLMLPGGFSFPGVELRDFSISVPDPSTATDQIDLKATVAASLGPVAFVVEGGGVEIHYRPNPAAGQPPFSIGPRLPDAVSVQIDAGIVEGGGYIRRKDKEYGGVFDLQFLKIGMTAICLINTDPFSLVVVISVRFTPKIELSYGFTLNGVGGILALERRVDTDELGRGIHDGTVDTILFPDNPIEAAPKILDKVHALFPPQDGAFAVGPIALLGWGSQAGFVVAKLGIVLCLPDPKLVLLGALQVGVPSTEVPESLRIVDLRAELDGEFSPEYVCIRVGLTNSKIALSPLSGDMGLYIRWVGDANFAMSVGGFNPRFRPPPQLADLRRVSIDYSPSGIPVVTLRAEGYFAITTNSLQFGARISLHARIGPATGDAWVQVDALFVWSPRFYFQAGINVGISVKAFGHSVVGAGFTGTLEGTTPWRIEGSASVDLGFMIPTLHFHLGPFEWGDSDKAPVVTVSPLDIVAEALSDANVWKPQLPAGGDLLVRLIKDDATPLLVHPLGMLEVKQQKVPIETRIDRIGSNAVNAHQVNLSVPRSSAIEDHSVVSYATDQFAAGHFINLTEDQQVSQPAFATCPSGIQFAATRSPLFGTASDAVYHWDTGFPHESGIGRILLTGKFVGLEAHVLRLNAVSRSSSNRVNVYELEHAEPVSILDQGMVTIRQRDDLSAVAAAPSSMTTLAATQVRRDLQGQGVSNLELVAVGVAQ